MATRRSTANGNRDQRAGMANGEAGHGPMPAELDTPGLILRRATESDLPGYCKRIYEDPRVMRMLPGQQVLTPESALPRVHANLVEHWHQHGFGPWVVIDKADQRLIGHCGLRYWPDTTDVEVLYALEPRVWGRGLATEAASAATAVAFDRLGLARLIAGAVAGNHASIAVLHKLGMRRWARRQFHGLELEMFQVSAKRWAAVHPVAPDVC